MGYTTKFKGRLSIEPPLNTAEIQYLRSFAVIRHTERGGLDAKVYGILGCYYVSNGNYAEDDTGVLLGRHNYQPPGQPGPWCDFHPTEDGKYLEWTGAKMTYNATSWVQYLITEFLCPHAAASAYDLDLFRDFTFNHKVNGVIAAEGERRGDDWYLAVVNNHAKRFDK